MNTDTKVLMTHTPCPTKFIIFRLNIVELSLEFFL